jgi:16S rRNA processing protein RimM
MLCCCRLEGKSLPTPLTPARILLAHIASAHGIRGELLLKTYTGAPEDVAAYGPLSDQTGSRKFAVRVVRVTPKGVIARIAGIDDRSAAEALKGTALHVERSKLPNPGDNEFYHTDLIGLAAVDAAGVELGTIERVLDFGAGTIIEVKLIKDARTELVPFTMACVPSVDLATRRATVVLPETVMGEDESAQGDEPAA